jgi:penicillin V acylase-like amidase (Ntn superfamily)
MRTKNAILISLLILFSLSFFQNPGNACTTFFLKDGERLIFGRNYDWHTGVGFVMVNKRNVVKTAMNFFDPAETSLDWVSLYGSITFNQYGREYPMGGMNEAGLVVEVMWLEGTKFPESDARPALGELPWVQYQLDTSRSIAEVLASDKRIRISPSSTPIHFLVSDAEGHSATIEFLDGKMVAHSNDSLPYSALANSTYDQSLEYLQGHSGFGGTHDIPATERSLDRFSRACAGIKAYDMARHPNIVDYAFGILDDVSQGKSTVWSIVYDVNNRRVFFKTVDKPALKSFAFKDFDFQCGTPSKIIDMNTARAGDLGPHFIPYSREKNRELIGRSFGSTDFLQDVPQEALDQLALYPESLPCQRKK